MVEETEDAHGLPPMERRPEEMVEEMGDVHGPPPMERRVALPKRIRCR